MNAFILQNQACSLPVLSAALLQACGIYDTFHLHTILIYAIN